MSVFLIGTIARNYIRYIYVPKYERCLKARDQYHLLKFDHVCMWREQLDVAMVS